MLYVICGISFALLVFGIIVLCTIPPDDSVVTPDSIDEDLIIITKDNRYLAIYRSNLEAFENNGWEVVYEDEEKEG